MKSSSHHATISRYREWLLESQAFRFYAAPHAWQVNVQKPNGEKRMRFVGQRIVKEIAGRPIAEGADRE